MFVNELFAENKSWNGFWRSAPVHPFNLPQPWSNWLYAVWQEPVERWNFALLLALFEKKAKLPSAEQQRGATEQWIIAQETVLLELQSRVRNESAGSEALRGQIHTLEQQMAQLQSAQDAFVEKAQQPVEVSHELTWLGENMEQLAALLQTAQAHAQADVQPELPPETAELLQRLEAANREIHHLSNENQQLRQEIEKIHRSRSWRMTKGYRYLGLQIHLLRQYGFVQRCKHFIKRVLRFVFSFMRKHPQVKHTAVNGLHKLGLYQPAYRLYRRMNPLPHSQYQADAQILSQTELQVMHPELLPPEVYEIYLKLTKNK